MKTRPAPTRTTMLVIGIALTFAVILLHMWTNGFCHVPTIYSDEAGYWTNAALFAGKDWSGVSGGLAWYSYGYSFLLAPLMLVIDDPITLYHAALALNAVMMAAGFVIVWRLLAAVFPRLHPAAPMAAAFACVCYTPYRIYSMTTWAETAVFLVTALIAFTLFHALRRPAAWRMVVLGLLCAYLFMIHNRCIGIVGAVCGVMLLAAVTKTVRWQHALLFLAALGAGFVLHILIKHHLAAVLWGSSIPAGNDAGYVGAKAKRALTTVDGLKAWLSVFTSQGFAAVVSGFCLPAAALLLLAYDRGFSLVRRFKDKAVLRVFTAAELLEVFLLAAMLLMLAISSLFMMDIERPDHILYTRYTDCVTGLLCAYAVCRMASMEMRHACVLLMPVVLILMAGADRAEVLLVHVQSDVYNILCTPFMADLRETFGEDYLSYAFTAIVPLAAALFFHTLLTKHRSLAAVLSAVVMAVPAGQHLGAATDQLRRSQAHLKENTALVRWWPEEIPHDVYILDRCGSFLQLAQFVQMDRHLIAVSSADEIPDGAYYLAPSTDVLLRDEDEIMDATQDKLLCRKGTKMTRDTDLPLSIMYRQKDVTYYPLHDVIVSAPTSHYLCFGPYMTLEPGDYTFTLDVHSELPADAETIGYAAVLSDQTEFARIDLDPAELADDTLILEAAVPERTDACEIVVVLYDPSTVRMQLDAIHCEEDRK